MSARSFAEVAAKAGYAVTVVDAFADKQTMELSEQAVVIEYGKHGFDANALLDALQQLDTRQFFACIYGSGFEAQPDLLQEVSKFVPVLGNTSETLTSLKSVAIFFSVLEQLNIVHPPWFKMLPVGSNAAAYLKKWMGGSGGTHIAWATNSESALLKNEYYQLQLSGLSVSLLFIANAAQVEVVGFNELWLNPCEEMPFRYGGAVSNIYLAQSVRAQLIDVAEKLTLAFGLLGLNSLDAIVLDDIVYVLEVNPRLSATVDLYDNAEANLLDQHVQVCLAPMKFSGGSLEHGLQGSVIGQAKAHAIVYALEDVQIAPTFDWPKWVVDIPYHPMQVKYISAGTPVCSVIAEAVDAESAKKLAIARVRVVESLLRLK